MVTGEVLRDILLETPWEGALASPVANPRQAALHASAPTVNRIHLWKDARIFSWTPLETGDWRAAKNYNLAADAAQPASAGRRRQAN